MLFHSLNHEEVLSAMKSTLSGLTQVEAQRRLIDGGSNTLKSEKKTNYLLKFLSQFKDVMVIILLISAVVSLFFAIHSHSSSELIDSFIIFGIVLLNSLLGFSQEIRAENALENLKKLSQPDSLVIRDNKEIKVKTSELVVGDIVILEAGDIVPADIYLLDSQSLKCDESALTGESDSVEKLAMSPLPKNTPLGERKNMCFSSTTVVYGRAKGVVVATGHNAEIGKIASMLTNQKAEPTPLQKSLNKLGEIITFTVLGIAIVIFLVDVLFAHHGYIDSFLTAVAIAVAAIPESLLAVVTIILSIGVTRLAKKNVIIKKLHAVETLGCCQVICSDKTGTITQNKMTVRSLFFDMHQVKAEDIEVNFTTDKSNDEDKLNKTYTNLLNCMSLCNNSKLVDNNFIGDPTEIALIDFATKRNYKMVDNSRIKELPFDSNRKLMSTLNIVNGKKIQFTKGAPDMLIDKCDKIMINGIIHDLTLENKQIIKKANSNMASSALRILALSMKVVDSEEISEDKLVFLGLVGMIDPPRLEVKDSINKCKRAGMSVVMITGDHKDTATAIAKELDIIRSEREVLEGSDLDKMSDKKLEESIHKYHVFARVTPEHKVRIVKALKSIGKVVAMTGDGVNDAPSVKSASIGIGMGKGGTEVTKSVSDMILADDNFSTIVVAVEEGRRIFNNIRKTIQFLISCNIAEVLTIFTLTMLFPKYTLFGAVQILFINLVTDTLPSIALGVDSSERSVMDIPPRDAKKYILSGRTMVDIIYQGVAQTVVAILVYLIGVFSFHSPMVASTMTFLTINMIQLFHMYNVRSRFSMFSNKIFDNTLLNFSFLLELSFLIFITVFSPLSSLIGLTALTLPQWLVVFSASISIIPICELFKLLLNHNSKKL